MEKELMKKMQENLLKFDPEDGEISSPRKQK